MNQQHKSLREVETDPTTGIDISFRIKSKCGKLNTGWCTEPDIAETKWEQINVIAED